METLEIIEEVKGNSLVKASEEINQGLAAFDNKKAELTELAEQSKIEIAGIDDKENIKKADTARKLLKATRVQITKDGKMMRDHLTSVSRKISEKEKELLGIITPVEDDLQDQLDKIEAEKERIRQEEIAKEEARVQKRIDALAEYGFRIDYTEVKTMPDETFNKYLSEAKSQFEKEQAEKAEAQRIEKERQEAEAARLEAERKELEELRAKQAEAQRIIDEQNAKIEVERKKVEEEKAALEAAKQKEIERQKLEAQLQKAREEAAEAARLKVIEDAKEAERLKKESEEEARIAEERKAARQPDKIKIQNYIAAIKAVPVPELKTEDAKAVMSQIQELISRFDNYSTEKANTL